MISFGSRVRELERKLCQLFQWCFWHRKLRVVTWGRGDRLHHRSRQLVGPTPWCWGIQCTPSLRFENKFGTQTIVIGDTPRGSDLYAPIKVMPHLPPTRHRRGLDHFCVLTSLPTGHQWRSNPQGNTRFCPAISAFVCWLHDHHAPIHNFWSFWIHDQKCAACNVYNYAHAHEHVDLWPIYVNTTQSNAPTTGRSIDLAPI